MRWSWSPSVFAKGEGRHLERYFRRPANPPKTGRHRLSKDGNIRGKPFHTRHCRPFVLHQKSVYRYRSTSIQFGMSKIIFWQMKSKLPLKNYHKHWINCWKSQVQKMRGNYLFELLIFAFFDKIISQKRIFDYLCGALSKACHLPGWRNW